MNNNPEVEIQYKSRGVGFLGLLTLVFITLKLTGVIPWSWWLVLLPIWWPIGLIAVVVIVVTIARMILFLFNKVL